MLGSTGLGLGSVGTAAEPDGGGGAAKTLAAIYTAGLVDPANDNLFPMATGNLRFWGSTLSEQFPNAAFFESSATPGDGRVAAWYTRRYYRVATSVGGFDGDAFVGFDPLWSGSFIDLNDFTITSERAAFTSDVSESGQPTLFQLGRQDYTTQGGFFDGPLTYPTPGFNSGVRVRYDTYLRNGIDGFQRRRTLTGFGQEIGYPLSTAAGITAQLYTAADFSNAPATDGNGVGWFIGYGVSDPLPDPPRAIFEAHCLSGAAPGGAWGLGFWVASAAGNNLGQIATMDWTNGIVFKAPVTYSDGSRPMRAWVSAIIDLTTTGTYNVIGPTPMRFLNIQCRLEVKTSTSSTVSPTLQGGTDAGASNLFASQSVAGLVGAAVESTFSLLPINPLPAVDLTANGFSLKVTAGATATALTARLILTGMLAPV